MFKRLLYLFGQSQATILKKAILGVSAQVPSPDKLCSKEDKALDDRAAKTTGGNGST